MIKNIACGVEDGKYYVQLCCGEEHIGKDCDCQSIGEDLSCDEAKVLAYQKSKELNVPVEYWCNIEENTFYIDYPNFITLFKENKDFREFVGTDKFIYCENRVVMNYSKYVSHREDGSVFLTQYAKENNDECCLIFSKKIIVKK